MGLSIYYVALSAQTLACAFICYKDFFLIDQGIDIAEKSLEARRDGWSGNINAFFDLIKMLMDH